MKEHHYRRAWGAVLAAVLALLGMSPAMRALTALPDALYMRPGEEIHVSFALPGSVELEQDEAVQAVASLDQRLEAGGQSVRVTAGEERGSAELVFRLLGILPLKRVSVSVERERTVIPGGHSLGVALRTEGVMVVGSSDLGSAPSPAREAGVRSGDRIVRLNGEAVEGAAQLSGLLKAGQANELEIVRDGEALTVSVTPATDPRDGVCRLGVWVRDSTAGIGTLSYYDPEDGSFGALGHAIEDVDTGVLLPVRCGGIYESSVVDVNKGRQGTPGELLGQFFDAEDQLGEITGNTDCGIFGTVDVPFANPLYPDGVPVSLRSEVREGPAQLLTTLTDGEIAAYDCQIVEVKEGGDDFTRSMVLRVTDEDLLARTGGIVQGMSGSPIIQDGKLAGAITHVLVSDPSRGYGIFAQNMLDAARSAE